MFRYRWSTTRPERFLLDAPTDRQFDQRLLLLLCESVHSVALLYEPVRALADSLTAYAAKTMSRSLVEGEQLHVGLAQRQLSGPGLAVERLDDLNSALARANVMNLLLPTMPPWPNVMHPVCLETLGAVLEATSAFFSSEARDVVADVVLRSLDLVAGD
jgi:hypothetical protein